LERQFKRAVGHDHVGTPAQNPAAKMASVILADDHVLMRKGMRRIIQEDSATQVIHEAGDGLELLELLETNSPDVVILDHTMPRLKGLEASKIIKSQYPEIKIILLTMHAEKSFFREARRIGVHGYVLKEEADTKLHPALKAVLAGKTFFPPHLASS
jgi:DNA-binding NarL/FixJ family response regulator